MRTVMVFMVALFFSVTLGCNYDYGKYGKDKTETKSEQKNEGGAPSN